MAFDFGLRYIGVAIGIPLTGTARGIATLSARDGKPRWRDLKQLIQAHGPTQLLVGLPLNMDGSMSDMAHNAQAFARELEKRTGLPVRLQDERLTSREAAAGLAEAKASGQAQTDHELAACLIAQDWMSGGAG